MSYQYACWKLPDLSSNTSNSLINLTEEYFGANYANVSSKRYALFHLLLRIDGESARHHVDFMLKEGYDLSQRLFRMETYLKSELNSALFLKNLNEIYFLKSCMATRWLWTYVTPLLLLLGFLGNIISFVVLCQNCMRQISTYVYLAALALLDNIVLFNGLLRLWIDKLFGWRIETTSKTACQLVNMIGVVTSCSSVWIIVAVTMERLLIIRFPLKAASLTSSRQALRVIGLIITTFVLISIHFLFSTDLRQMRSEKETTCEIESKIARVAWGIVDGVFYSYLPILSIVIMNTFIMLELRRSAKHRAAITSHQQRRRDSNNFQLTPSHLQQSKRNSECANTIMTQLTVMLIVVSAIFIITTLPEVITRSVHIGLSLTNEKFDRGHTGFNQLLDTITQLLMYTNHAVNFFLYCFKGSKFRAQLKRILYDAHCHRPSATFNRRDERTNNINMATYTYARSNSVKDFDN